MPLTNHAAERIAFLLGSQLTNTFMSYFVIGSGSGTFAKTQTTLLSERDRNPITGSPDFTTTRKVGFTGDFSANEMSGTILTEFGMLGSHTGTTGSIWQRETFGSIAFDGTNELQILSTFEVLI